MRIIVENRSSLSDTEAVARVSIHMRQPSQLEDRTYLAGALYNDGVFVTHDVNKKSHRFVVSDSVSDPGRSGDE